MANDWYCVMYWNGGGNRQRGAYKQIHKHKDGGGRIAVNKRGAARSKKGYLEYSGRLNKSERDKAVSYCKRKGFAYSVTRGRKYPFVTLKAGEEWPKDNRLLRRMNELGRYLNRRIHIISGFRSWAKQNYYYQLFLQGKGPAANSPSVMDDHRVGEAADCGVIAADGRYHNLGEHPVLRGNSQRVLKKFGLRLKYRPPYSWYWYNKGSNWEAWHCDAGIKRPAKFPTQK